MSTAGAEASTATKLSRHRGFLGLLVGQFVSQIGSQVTLLALPLTAILLLGASAAEMGLLSAAQTFPLLIVGLFAGVWIDRMPRRLILIASNVIRALLLASIPLTAATNTLTLAQLYVVGFLVGTLAVFFDVAYQSFLPSLVGRPLLVDANGKLEASRSVAEIIGPSLGGALIQLLSAPIAILADALSFVLSAAFFVRIRVIEPITRSTARAGLWRSIGEGLLFVGRNRSLRTIAGYTAGSNFFFSLLFAVYTLFVIRDLGVSPVLYGVIYTVGSVGGVLGALFTSRVTTRIGFGRALLAGALLTRLGFLPVPLAPENVPVAATLLALSQFAWGFGIPIYNVNQVSFRQAITPDELLGRMNASVRFVVLGTRPLGAIAGGMLGEAFGLRTALWVAVIGSFLVLVSLLSSPALRLQHAPRSEAEAAGL